MKKAGFTLIELLVVVSIIGILAALLLPAVNLARRSAGLSRETQSARQVMGAYVAYTADNDGKLLPGFADFPATDDRGQSLHSPVNSRYPWRLAPYLKYDMSHFFSSEVGEKLNKLASGPREDYVYSVSVQPALGINAVFVGGDYQILPPTNAKAVNRYGQFCVTTMAQAVNASRLIVFASAGGSYRDTKLSGYFKVEAPNFTGRNWEMEYTSSKPAESYGYVDFRWNGKALAVMLDGHAETLDFEQMEDMRRWSNLAAEANNAGWRLGN